MRSFVTPRSGSFLVVAWWLGDFSSRTREEVSCEGYEVSKEGPLDYGRLRRHRSSVRLELDCGAYSYDYRGDHHPRVQCDPDPSGLLSARLSAPRDRRVLAYTQEVGRGAAPLPLFTSCLEGVFSRNMALLRSYGGRSLC